MVEGKFRSGTCAGKRGRCPVDHLGLVDAEAMVVVRVQARGRADGAIDVLGLAAAATDEVVVVVADAVLVAGGRVGWLDAADDALVGEDVQDVVDRLAGDCPDFPADGFGEVVGRRVGVVGDRPQHRQTLRRDGKVMLTKGGLRVLHGA